MVGKGVMLCSVASSTVSFCVPALIEPAISQQGPNNGSC